MARENVEIVRQAIAAFNGNDLELIEELCDPEVRFEHQSVLSITALSASLGRRAGKLAFDFPAPST